MSDLGAGGTVDFSNIPSYTGRMKSNATDIRRTVAPEPTVIGTKKIVSSAGFTNANNTIFGDGDTKPLNSGVLFRSVEGGSKALIGFTAPGLAEANCFHLEDGDDLFLPTTDLGKVFIKTLAAGATLSVLGE
tara:strand:+ start:84 stop:479 length:396 start_codon:yes stop_codon:yes gene_type:complete